MWLFSKIVRYLNYRARRVYLSCYARTYRWLMQVAGHRMLARQDRVPVEYGTIVSLTSYGSRLQTADITILTLLLQRPRPEFVVLWVADQEVSLVSEKLKRLRAHGLKIKLCDDLKSHKKYFFAISEFPEKKIVTADDDILYRPGWFRLLVEYSRANPSAVGCHRAHFIEIDANHSVAPYQKWPRLIDDRYNNQAERVFPTSGGGAIFPAGSLVSPLLNERLISEYALRADDFWLKLICLKNGVETHVVTEAHRHILTCNDGDASHALWTSNIVNNDKTVASLTAKFGFQAYLVRNTEN